MATRSKQNKLAFWRTPLLLLAELVLVAVTLLVLAANISRWENRLRQAEEQIGPLSSSEELHETLGEGVYALYAHLTGGTEGSIWEFLPKGQNIGIDSENHAWKEFNQDLAQHMGRSWDTLTEEMPGLSVRAWLTDGTSEMYTQGAPLPTLRSGMGADALPGWDYLATVTFDEEGRLSIPVVWKRGTGSLPEEERHILLSNAMIQPGLDIQEMLGKASGSRFSYYGWYIMPRGMTVTFGVPSELAPDDLLSLIRTRQLTDQVWEQFYDQPFLRVLLEVLLFVLEIFSLCVLLIFIPVTELERRGRNLCSLPCEVLIAFVLGLLLWGSRSYDTHWTRLWTSLRTAPAAPRLLGFLHPSAGLADQLTLAVMLLLPLLLFALIIVYSAMQDEQSDMFASSYTRRGVCALRNWLKQRRQTWEALPLEERPLPGRRAFVLAAFGAAALAGLLVWAGWGGLVPVLVLAGILVCGAQVRRAQKQLHQDYLTVLEGTQQLSQGELDTPIPEEAGPFSTLRGSLNSVQTGFRQAVEAELKSQTTKTELITNVSHDLKTPLTAIISYTDLLRQPGLTEEERQSYLDTLDRKSQRLKQLIQDLFDVSKAVGRDVTPDLAPIDLCALLHQMRFEMADVLEASGLEFHWKLPEEKVMTLLDGARTSRVFENLLVNITKYSLPGTRAYVELKLQGEEARVIFKNISAQVLPEDAERLAERFVRGDTSRSTEGSGLGLAIAKSFTELQNGTFSLSVDGDLFKVEVRFPLYRPAPDEQA